jgi:hypothetical protein
MATRTPQAESVDGVPVECTAHDAFCVWDLREWDGDVETMAEINEAWLAYHDEPGVVGTVSVFPENVIVDGELQSFISEGWNEAGEAAGLQHLAIVGDGLASRAVKRQMAVPDLTMDVFEEVKPAVEWLREQTA